MRTSQAARYARWAALAAVSLAAIVAVVYARRAWQAAQVRRKAPPVVPSAVQQRSNEFAFSKVENDRTLFTVRASRATEFKEQNKSLLEDVWITVYGRQGTRNDNIHTRQCNYEPATGRIICQGDVQLDLAPAGAAREHPETRAIHVATRNISFDRETGVATTQEPVTFRFPSGEGRGIGAVYRTSDAAIELQHGVELTLVAGGPRAASGAASEKSPQAIFLTAGSLAYRSGDRTLRLSSPVHAKQGALELTAGSVAVVLDEDLRARSAAANGEPRVTWGEPRGQSILQADKFTAFLHPQGWTERLLAEGHVHGSRRVPAGKGLLEAERLEVEMSPRDNEPRQASVRGKVQIQSVEAGRSQELQTEEGRAFFVSDRTAAERRIDRAETLTPATLKSKTGGESTVLQAQRLAATFNAQNRLQQLLGHDGVQITRAIGADPPDVSSSRELVMDYGGQSDWSQVEQSGDVRFRQGDRTATAEHAKFVRSADTILLTGSATATDSQGRTTAESISFNQRTGEVRAEGGVRTSYSSTQRTAANLAPEPANITADRLQANHAAGRALYSGRARLWQGGSVLQADSMELFRDTQRLEAHNNVRGAFPQASSAAKDPAKDSARNSGKPIVWRFRAAGLTYWGGERKAHLTGSVSAESSQGRIDADAMDLIFTGQNAGAAQLSRANAEGHVTVRQGDRWGAGERADYGAEEGKFTLSGGRPALYDASGNIATGRQLTFFLASDKILIDSGEGSRTLTKHRVEK